MDFPVTNTMIKSLNKNCCNWGQKKTSYDREGHIKSNTSPLWINPSPGIYKLFFVLALICSLIFVGSFIAIQFYNNSLDNVQQNLSHFPNSSSYSFSIVRMFRFIFSLSPLANFIRYSPSTVVILLLTLLFLNCNSANRSSNSAVISLSS